MKVIVKSMLFVLLCLVCCDKFALAQGPVVEFVNRESFEINIAVAAWNNNSFDPGPNSSKLAVLREPFEWVQGWYKIKPGETIKLNRGHSEFYYTRGTWKNHTTLNDPHYFWVCDYHAFKTTRTRPKNEIRIIAYFGDGPSAESSAPQPDRIMWDKMSNNNYRNMQNVQGHSTLKNSGFAAYPFAEVAKSVKRVVFSNGKCYYQN